MAAAAYRSGTILTDERSGRAHRYHNRKGVVASLILLPPGAPEDYRNRSTLWNAAELAETRKNSSIAREVILALPHELPAIMREAIVRDFGAWLVHRYRVAVDMALHSPVPGDGHDPRNHHAHVLMTTREVTPDGLGKKTRSLDDKVQGPHEIELIRLTWETLVNDALKNAGLETIQIDRRTLEDQGIDRIPQIHIGPEGKAAKSPVTEEKEKQEDEEESGETDGQQGKSGSGDLPPKISKTAEDHKGREIDYTAIDQNRSRADMVEEIKSINAQRSLWPESPLTEQIQAIEHEMHKLDRKVRQFETLYEKTSLSSGIKKAIVEVAKFAKELVVTRLLNRERIQRTEQDYKTRILRQSTHYGRKYRTGIHEQIQTMKTRLHVLEEMQTSYNKYKMFVDSIEKAIKQSPTINFTEKATSKTITTQESTIKLGLKADLVKEGVPEKYKPEPDKTPKLTKAFNAQTPQATPEIINAPIKQTAYHQPIPQSRERQDWFIPASDKMRDLWQSIERTLAERGHKVQAAPNITPDTESKRCAFNHAATSGKRTTCETVREKTRQEAKAKRENIPPQYRKDAYEPETLKPSRMAGAFNGASTNNANNPSRPHKPDHKPQ